MNVTTFIGLFRTLISELLVVAHYYYYNYNITYRNRDITAIFQRRGALRTWYLLVELNGISHTFGLSLRKLTTLPMDTSTHLSSADSDASPLHSLQVQHTAEILTNEHVY